MTASLGTATLTTIADLTGLHKGLGQAKQDADGTFLSLGSLGSSLLTAGIAGATAAVVALGAGLTFAIGEAIEAQGVQAQLNAVIESTGGVAGVSAAEAIGYADALTQVTRFSDEAILSGESMLLTFTEIGEEVFPQATETMLDMSQALGQDLQASAIQLGKALNDPIKGVTALQRVGVTFTDSQKDMIAAMVEVGDVAGAQALILAELRREFGGSARAAGQTFGGQMDILKNSISNVAEEWGMALLPILTDFIANVAPGISDALNVLTQTELPAFVQAVEKVAGGLLSAFNAGMALITWSGRIDLALQENAVSLLINTTSYDQYAVGMIAATVAAGRLSEGEGKLLLRHIEGEEVYTGLGKSIETIINLTGLLTEEEYTQQKRVEALTAIYAAAGVTNYEWVTSEEAAITTAEEGAGAAGLLAGAVQAAAGAYDAMKTAIGLAGDALNALSKTEVDAERKRLVLKIATQEMTTAETEAALAQLETLEVLERLNADIEAGTAGNEEFYAVMLGGVDTLDEYNALMGLTTNTISGTEAVLIGTAEAGGGLNQTFADSTAVQDNFRADLLLTEEALYGVAGTSEEIYGAAGGIDAIGSAAATAKGKVDNLADSMKALGDKTPGPYIPDSPPPLAQGFLMVADAAGTLDTEIESLAGHLEGLGEVLATGLKAGAEELEGLLDAAGKVSSLAGKFAGIFEERTLDPLKTQLEGIDEEIEDILSMPMDEGAANRLNALTMERAELAREIADQEERILHLQEQQQQLDFLQAQLDLLELAQSAGLDASIFEGLLGLGADPAALTDLMDQVLQALIDQANETLEAGSPSRVFARIGESIPEGLTDSLYAGIGDINDAMSNVTDELMTPDLEGRLPSTTTVAGLTRDGRGFVTNAPVYQVNMTGAIIMSQQEADKLMKTALDRAGARADITRRGGL